MEARTIKFISESCSGETKNAAPSTMLRRICTYSRQAQPGDLFIAIEGEKFDAHDFLAEVFAKGATVGLIEKAKIAKAPENAPVVLVEKTRIALGQIAAAYRNQFDLKVLAVCGSNGKTSTKELVAAVLAEKLPVVKSEASFNNDIGVPLTLLK